MDQQGIPVTILAYLGVTLAVAVTIITVVINIVLTSNATAVA